MAPRPPMLSGAWPLLGHVPAFARERIALLQRGRAELGPVFGMRLGRQPVAVLIGPELHEIFFAKTDTALRMDKAYQFLRAAFGDIGFTASPEQYRAERHILHGPFRGGRMAQYVAVMDDAVLRWMEGLGDSGHFEVMSEMKGLTQDIAARALLGDAFAAEMTAEFWGLYEDIAASLDPLMPAHWPVPKNLRRDRARKRMVELLTPVIAARRSGADGADDFLQSFVETHHKDGRPVSDEKIVNYLLGLLFAGHETTSGQAAWTVIEVLRHPAYRFLMEQELKKAVESGAAIDLAALGRMRLFQWAVKESERLRPVTDVLLRFAAEDFEAGGYEIPQGWMVMISPAVAHRDAGLFPNPHVFDPFRYGPERAEDKKHKHALVTFGGGVHKCTGMNFAYNEITIILGRLLLHYDLELETDVIGPVYGMGASHPSATWIRYRRIGSPTRDSRDEALTAGGLSACPFHEALQQG